MEPRRARRPSLGQGGLARLGALVLPSLALACLALAGCQGEWAPSYLPPASTPPPTEAVLVVSVPEFADALLDLSVDVVDAQTLAPLFSQSYPSQVTPFSVECALPTTPVNVSGSIAFHLVPAAAIHNGNNSTAGLTLTDLGMSFTDLVPPMFVMDDPLAPIPVLVDVLSVSGSQTLALAAAFPAGTYYLFHTRQARVEVSYRLQGTDYRAFVFSDNTLGTFQFSSSF